MSVGTANFGTGLETGEIGTSRRHTLLLELDGDEGSESERIMGYWDWRYCFYALGLECNPLRENDTSVTF